MGLKKNKEMDPEQDLDKLVQLFLERVERNDIAFDQTLAICMYLSTNLAQGKQIVEDDFFW